MLEPLKQFICDECGETIRCPEDGWLEWDLEWSLDHKTRRHHGFRIVHHVTASPRAREAREDGRARGREDGCYRHPPMDYSQHLYQLLAEPMVRLLSLLDSGEIHEPMFKAPEVSDIREWTTLARRLTVPYYEEARHCLRRNRREIIDDGVNEITVYTAAFLRGQIEAASEDE